MAPNAAPAGERLARMEGQIEQLVNATNRVHADLREHIDWQQRVHDQQTARVNALEQSAEQTRTHLKWMKAVWLAVQGTVVGWMSVK